MSLKADSAESKIFGKRCQNVGCENHGKYRCSKCAYTRYCSMECQTNDWPIHKGPCAFKTSMRRNMELSDKLARFFNDVDGMLPSQVMREVREFKTRFSAILITGAVNCFRDGSGALRPEWKTQIVTVNLRRRPNPPEKSRLWARYTVESIELVLWKDLVEDPVVHEMIKERDSVLPNEVMVAVQVKGVAEHAQGLTVFQERLKKQFIWEIFEVWDDWKQQTKMHIENISLRDGRLDITT